MLRKNAKIELLKRVPLFERCSNRELGQIAMLADELDLPAARNLTNEGSGGFEFIVLVEGAADVVRQGRVVNELGPGDFVGEMGLMADTRRNATVTATSAVKVIVMTAQAFRHTAREHPEVAEKIRAAIEERCRALEPAS
jgi:CRP-like cAMP-binding protein